VIARRRGNLWFIISCLALVLTVSGASAIENLRLDKGIEYARVGNTALLLDLYLPTGRPDVSLKPKLVVWIHGGAWRSGSRSDMPLAPLVEQGYAVASVDYRLTTVAPFPAQVHDIKAAIRYLRAEHERLGIGTRRIAVVGSSAGGHLAALVGVTNGHRELEGDIGDHRDQSSEVQAIVDFFGPTNLTTILDQSTPHGLGVRIPALQLLLGGQPADKPELAGLASPVFHVNAADPPLLIIHGDQDPQVPINQSHELMGRYEDAKLSVQFEVIHGVGHGGDEFYDARRLTIVKKFLDARL
jgi:acetyl esterase/lipase